MTWYKNPEETYYPNANDILTFYAEEIGCSVDDAVLQLRDRGILEAALHRPGTHAPYDNADIAQQAAVLAHGIAEGQPFIDGNKRVALIALEVFLHENGFELVVGDQILAAWIIALARHEGYDRLGADELADLHQSSSPIENVKRRER